MYNQYISHDEVKQWWNVVHNGRETLQENETVRAVLFVEDKVFTAQDKISSMNELIQYIEEKYNKHQTNFGISVSSAVFEFDVNRRPSRATFKYTDTVVVDIDAYVVNTKKRVNIVNLGDDWGATLAAQAHAVIFQEAKRKGINWPRPQLIGLTGGGLQLVYKFDKTLTPETVDKIYQFLKDGVPKTRYQGYMVNPLGSVANIDLEFDASAFDIVHVQRVLGTWNPKYQARSKIVKNWSPQTISAMTYGILRSAIEQADFTSVDGDKLRLEIEKLRDMIEEAFVSSTDEFNVDELLSYAKINAARPLMSKANFSSIEYKIATSLNHGRSIDLVRDAIHIIKDTPQFTAIRCPFHTGDDHSSFAIYKNPEDPNAFDVYMDFHDGSKYNIVSFYAKLHNISKSQAIDEILKISGLDIKKTERKDLERLSAEEAAEELVKQVNTTEYIYYRLANKQKSCIIRHIDSGKSYIFDGLKALARQVLKDRLGVEHVDNVLLNAFVEEFENKILIDGFERFQPGMPPLFKENDISIINTWVPTRNYKIVRKIAKKLPKRLSWNAALKFIEEKCPYTNIFVHQLVQKGSLLWFYNWIAATSQFKVMPTVPFIFGTFGVGKNLFISEVMEWYLNSEYVDIVNTERITKNFNAHMESSQLIVIDESSLYDSKSVDALKMLSGNRKIKIEKKGVDAVDAERHFNFITFSNRLVPAYINSQERRFSFFETTIPLSITVSALGLSVSQFIEKVKEELPLFFAIMSNVVVNEEWINMNIKDGTFYSVMFRGHGFGRLLMTIVNNDWQSLSIQLTENMKDEAQINSSIALVHEMETHFTNTGKIPLPLINRYLDSLNYKARMSISDFIRDNKLTNMVSMESQGQNVYVVVDVEKLKKMIESENVIIELMKNFGIDIAEPESADVYQLLDGSEESFEQEACSKVDDICEEIPEDFEIDIEDLDVDNEDWRQLFDDSGLEYPDNYQAEDKIKTAANILKEDRRSQMFEKVQVVKEDDRKSTEAKSKVETHAEIQEEHKPTYEPTQNKITQPEPDSRPSIVIPDIPIPNEPPIIQVDQKSVDNEDEVFITSDKDGQIGVRSKCFEVVIDKDKGDTSG